MILISNDPASINDRLRYDIADELVSPGVWATCSGVLTVPPRKIGDWHYLWLTPGRVEAHPRGKVPSGRLIGAVGTLSDHPGLTRFRQDGDIVKFDGKRELELRWSPEPNVWSPKGINQHVPVDIASMVWLRVEVGRRDGRGEGFCQANIATNGTDGFGAFASEIKGWSRESRISMDTTQDQVWQPIDGALIHVRCNENSTVSLLVGGFRVRL